MEYNKKFLFGLALSCPTTCIFVGYFKDSVPMFWLGILFLIFIWVFFVDWLRED